MKSFITLTLICISFSSILLCNDKWEIIETEVNSQLTDIELLSDDTIIISNFNGDILKSTDLGISWEVFHAIDDVILAFDFFDEDNGIFFSSENGGAFKAGMSITEDGGETWERFYDFPLILSKTIKYFDKNSMSLVAIDGISKSLVYIKTSDQGETWTTNSIASGLTRNSFIESIDSVWVITDKGKLFYSSDGGETWDMNFDFNNPSYTVVFVNTNRGYIYGDNKLYITENRGVHWEKVEPDLGLTEFKVYGFFEVANEYYLIINNNSMAYIYKSIDMTDWEKVFEDNILITDKILMYKDSLLFIPGDEGRIIKGILDSESSLKKDISVFNIQNIHPNPATSQITISLGEEFVSEPEIDIIDYLGNVIRWTPSGRWSPSEKSITINTSSLSPGVYFLRVRSGEKVEVRKFVVI